MFKKIAFNLFFFTLIKINLIAQSSYELNTNWKCVQASTIKDDGITISNFNYNIQSWKAATIPGTVLTTMLNNKEIPDPFLWNE